MNSASFESKPFDLLAELAKFGQEYGISLTDPLAVPRFASFVGATLGRALSDPALIHGQRTEAMFEAMLVSLGEYSLLKAEDKGLVHPEGRFIAPDFRVVLRDGTQWLIEVKNAYIQDPFHQRRRFMNKEYREKLENYASATGGQLKLAVYWGTWGIWTLVSPEQFVDEQGNVSLDMSAGIIENELGCLGDLLIGTRAPLRLRLEADPDTVSPVSLDGVVGFKTSNLRLYCGHNEITDPIEEKIAWLFMQYGQWRMTGPQPMMQGDTLEAVEFRWDPEGNEIMGIGTVGTVSQVFSCYYSEQTMEDDRVVQLHAPPQPDWFSPLLADSYKGKALPLWRFKFQAKHLSADLLPKDLPADLFKASP